jgi:hypothetical protein
MTREELIEFAKYLDEGCDLLGEGYIESRTDEYLQKVANKNFVLADVSGSLQDRLFELANDFAVAKKGEVAVKLHSIHNGLQ